MFRRAGERLGQFARPGLWRLAGAGVDEIEGGAVESRGGDVEGAQCLLRRMQAAEQLQIGVVQRLHAERDAIDARRAIAPETRGLDAGRIGLQRDFGVGVELPQLADASR